MGRQHLGPFSLLRPPPRPDGAALWRVAASARETVSRHHAWPARARSEELPTLQGLDPHPSLAQTVLLLAGPALWPLGWAATAAPVASALDLPKINTSPRTAPGGLGQRLHQRRPPRTRPTGLRSSNGAFFSPFQNTIAQKDALTSCGILPLPAASFLLRDDSAAGLPPSRWRKAPPARPPSRAARCARTASSAVGPRGAPLRHQL